MSTRLTLVAPGTGRAGGAPLAWIDPMRCIEVDTGRWRIELGQGVGIEIVLLFSRTIAFVCYGGGFVAEMPVGQA